MTHQSTTTMIIRHDCACVCVVQETKSPIDRTEIIRYVRPKCGEGCGERERWWRGVGPTVLGATKGVARVIPSMKLPRPGWGDREQSNTKWHVMFSEEPRMHPSNANMVTTYLSSWDEVMFTRKNEGLCFFFVLHKFHTLRLYNSGSMARQPTHSHRTR